jgi:hypothetical protein
MVFPCILVDQPGRVAGDSHRKNTVNQPLAGRPRTFSYRTQGEQMVPDAGLTSNRLFEVLADWNQLLQHTSFRFGSPINGNEWEDSPTDEVVRPYRKRRKRA